MIKKLALTGVAVVLAASFSISAMARGSYVVELKCEKSNVPKKQFKTYTDDSDEAIIAAVKTARDDNWCDYAFKNSSNILDYVISVQEE